MTFFHKPYTVKGEYVHQLIQIYEKNTQNPINKWTKKMKRQFTNEGMQISIKYMEKYSPYPSS